MTPFAAVLAIAVFSADLGDPSIGAHLADSAEMKNRGGLFADLPKRDGVIILCVLPYGPSVGKLSANDLIISVNDKPVTSINDYRKLSKSMEIGKKVKLQVRTFEGSRWAASKNIMVSVSTLGEIAKSAMKIHKDKITGKEFVWHLDAWGKRGDPPSVINDNLSFIFPLDEGKPGNVFLRVCIDQKDWVFAESITLSNGSDKLEIDLSSASWNRDAHIGHVSEWCLDAPSNEVLVKIGSFLLQDKVMLRVSGSKSSKDREISIDERLRMIQVLMAHGAMSK